jgi:mannitol-1-phosphate/altronate dehydrogenase
MERDKYKKTVMYGTGNIGRGLIDQLLSLSGYEIILLDI